MCKMKTKMYRQGDVLIMRVNSIPDGAVKRARENGMVVLAHGEVTGHAHAIADEQVDLLDGSGVTYLEVRRAVAMLDHEEHGRIEISRGKYIVRRQRQYTPSAIFNVAD